MRFLGVDSTGITQEFVVPDSVKTLSYTNAPLAPGLPSVASFSMDSHHVWLVGKKFNPLNTPDYSAVFQVSWTDALGVSRSTTIVSHLDLNTRVPGLGQVDAEYFFVIDGDPFPPLATISDYTALDNRTTAVTNATGAIGPNIDILLSALGGTVTEDDVITGTRDGDALSGGLGNDTILGLDGRNTLNGDGGHDKLVGGRDSDKLYGGAGNDTLIGSDDNDQLYGGAGDDTLDGGALSDTLTGNGGDFINGADGDDVLTGAAGGDFLSGGNDDDQLFGGDGKDGLSGDRGADMLDDGAGNDTLSGGVGIDQLIGRTGNDDLSGGDGADVLKGGEGDDILNGGAGHDLLIGGAGNDTVSFLYDYSNRTKTVVDLADATLNSGLALGDTLSSIENVTGGNGNNRLYGTAGSNRLTGGSGNDWLEGRGGDDILSGGGGHDVLIGGAGNDVLNGSHFGGELFGGAGNDVLKSGFYGGLFERWRRGRPVSGRPQFREHGNLWRCQNRCCG